MKLWQKISLICGGILIIIVALCSALLLTMAKETLLTSAYERAEARQQEVVSAFIKEADLHALKSNSESIQRALMQYCFAKLSESRAALIVNGKTVYSQLPFAPEGYATPGDNGRRAEYIGKINGKEYYITASTTHISNFPDKECRVYFAEDISPIHESIRAMTGVFAFVRLAFSVVGVGLIILLVRRSMTPLLKLQATVERKRFTQADADKMLAVFTKGSALYQEQGITKQEAQAQLEHYEAIARGEIPYEHDGSIDDVPRLIEHCKELVSTAPDEGERTAATTVFAALDTWNDESILRHSLDPQRRGRHGDRPRDGVLKSNLNANRRLSDLGEPPELCLFKLYQPMPPRIAPATSATSVSRQ